MDTIIKKITLIDFKNYNPNVSVKCLDEDSLGCWNKIPMDLIVTDSNLKKINLPFVKKKDSEGNEYTILRYYDIKKLFLFFEEYERSMVYYRLIEVKGKKKWAKSKKPESFDRSNIFVSLPSVYDFDECGIVIAINTLHEQYLTYTGGGDLSIKMMIENLLKKYFENDETLTYDTPYINIPLLLNTNIMDCGEMLNELQKWEPLKKYHKGDIVFYEDSYYVALNNNSSDEFNVKQWEKLNFDTPNNEEVVSKEVYCESKLNNFISQRKAYDDDGNVLPFIIDGLNIFLMYKCGFVNYNSGKVDSLNEVALYINDEWVVLTCEDGKIETKGLYKIDTNTYSGATSIRFTYLIGAETEKTGEGEEVLRENTGIKYEEIRKCYLKEESYKIENIEKSYKYIYVEPHSTYSVENSLPVSYAKIINISTNTRFETWERNVKYNVNDIVYDYITNAYYKCNITNINVSVENTITWSHLDFGHVFVNDKLFGTTYVDIDLPKIEVDRGNYAAMERHYILGEINSFDDLEKYRNNMFKL